MRQASRMATNEWRRHRHDAPRLLCSEGAGGWWLQSDPMCALPKDKTLPEFQTEACARFYEWADAMLAARSAS